MVTSSIASPFSLDSFHHHQINYLDQFSCLNFLNWRILLWLHKGVSFFSQKESIRSSKSFVDRARSLTNLSAHTRYTLFFSANLARELLAFLFHLDSFTSIDYEESRTISHASSS